jgi:hypothetical protein
VKEKKKRDGIAILTFFSSAVFFIDILTKFCLAMLSTKCAGNVLKVDRRNGWSVFFMNSECTYTYEMPKWWHQSWLDRKSFSIATSPRSSLTRQAAMAPTSSQSHPARALIPSPSTYRSGGKREGGRGGWLRSSAH